MVRKINSPHTTPATTLLRPALHSCLRYEHAAMRPTPDTRNFNLGTTVAAPSYGIAAKEGPQVPSCYTPRRFTPTRRNTCPPWKNASKPATVYGPVWVVSGLMASRCPWSPTTGWPPTLSESSAKLPSVSSGTVKDSPSSIAALPLSPPSPPWTGSLNSRPTLRVPSTSAYPRSKSWKP